MGRLQQDVQQICQTYLNWLGDAPFSSDDYDGYTFMTYATVMIMVGLSISSTSLVTPRSDLPTAQEKQEPSEGYQRFLDLCSHEYFHSWWVKTVRPDVMLNVDLRREAYTPYFGYLRASRLILMTSCFKPQVWSVKKLYETTAKPN